MTSAVATPAAAAKPSTPSIDPAQHAHVKEQFGRCIIRPTFFDDFYKDFTGRSPEIRSMFAHTNMATQKEALRAGLAFLVMYADGGNPFATAKLDRLGASHSRGRLNVRPDMYPIWIQSLISTVRKHVPNFTPESQAAWQAVLQHGVNRIVSHY